MPRSRSSKSPRINTSTGPTVLRTEQAQLLGYVYIDDRDLGGYVADAKAAVANT